MPYLRAPTYRVIRVIDSAGRWRPDFEGKKSCSREMEMDELEPAMEDVGMGWSRVTEQDGAVYYWHEASEQSRWEPPPHSTPNGCGGARLGHRMCEGCGAKQACFATPTERKRRWCMPEDSETNSLLSWLRGALGSVDLATLAWARSLVVAVGANRAAMMVGGVVLSVLMGSDGSPDASLESLG